MIDALKGDDAPAPTAEDAENDVEGAYNDSMLKVLNKKINMARRTRCGIDVATVRSALQSSQSNGIIDSGADTCLLGSAFRMLGHSDRMSNVQGFDESLVKADLKIGTEVAAFDIPEGETMLVLVNEAIDHTRQENTISGTMAVMLMIRIKTFLFRGVQGFSELNAAVWSFRLRW